MAEQVINIYDNNGNSYKLGVNVTVNSAGNVTSKAYLSCESVALASSSSCTLQLLVNGVVKSSNTFTNIAQGSKGEVSDTSLINGINTFTARWVNTSSVDDAPNSGEISVEVNCGVIGTATIALSSSSLAITSSQRITLTPGENNTITSVTWSCNGGTGSLSTSSQTWGLIGLEPYLRSTTSATCIITVKQKTGSDVTASFTVTIPDEYVPTISISTITKLNPVNNHLVANTSGIQAIYVTGLAPSTNTATISSVVVESQKYVPTSVGTPSVSVNTSNKTATLSKFPSYSGNSYGLEFTLKVTDSRGRTNTVTVTQEQVTPIYTYTPPLISEFTATRCDKDGNSEPHGTYGMVSVKIDTSETLTTSTILINNKTYQLAKGEYNYYVKVGNDDLNPGTRYLVILQVKTSSMPEILTQTTYLETVEMPISLYDDGSQVGVSIGEQAFHYSDVDSIFLNLAKGCDVRAVDNSSNAVVESASNLVDGRRHIKQDILNNLKFVLISESDYSRLQEKDFSTIYFVY